MANGFKFNPQLGKEWALLRLRLYQFASGFFARRVKDLEAKYKLHPD